MPANSAKIETALFGPGRETSARPDMMQSKGSNGVKPHAFHIFYMRLGVHREQVLFNRGFGIHEFHMGFDDVDYRLHPSRFSGRVHGVDLIEVVVKKDLHLFLHP